MCVTTLCAGAAQEYNECEYFELRKQTVYWAAMYLGLAWPVVTQLMLAVTATDDVQISKLLWKTVRTKRTNMHSSYLCSFPNSPFLLAFSPLDLLSLDHRQLVISAEFPQTYQIFFPKSKPSSDLQAVKD